MYCTNQSSSALATISITLIALALAGGTVLALASNIAAALHPLLALAM
jgi:hypothetical protein